MNETETNIKHGYSLMVCDARGAIWNPGAAGAQISKAGCRGRIYATRGAILKSGAQYWGTQGLDFLTILALGAGPAK